MEPYKIKRSEAAKLLDSIRVLLVTSSEAELRDNITGILALQGIGPASKCTGEAHSNAFIDNCGVCMPRWGIVMKPIRIT